MEYFILREDKSNQDTISFSINEEYMKIEKPLVIPAKLSKDRKMGDFICRQRLHEKLFLVSNELKEVIEVYSDQELQAVPVFFVDAATEVQYCYWHIAFPKVDYVDEGAYVFQYEQDREQYLIVSLHLAEYMLRQNFYGMEYISMKTILEGEYEHE